MVDTAVRGCWDVGMLGCWDVGEGEIKDQNDEGEND
jgi:hypothetical protein